MEYTIKEIDLPTLAKKTYILQSGAAIKAAAMLPNNETMHGSTY